MVEFIISALSLNKINVLLYGLQTFKFPWFSPGDLYLYLVQIKMVISLYTGSHLSSITTGHSNCLYSLTFFQLIWLIRWANQPEEKHIFTSKCLVFLTSKSVRLFSFTVFPLTVQTTVDNTSVHKVDQVILHKRSIIAFKYTSKMNGW